MRTEVAQLVSLGPLPEESALPIEVARREKIIRSIRKPLTLEEAVALSHLLGPDNCFGLAWTVVHLIESAPKWSIEHVPNGDSPWLSILRTRLQNSKGASTWTPWRLTPRSRADAPWSGAPLNANV